jgi:hypothetical protein
MDDTKVIYLFCDILNESSSLVNQSMLSGSNSEYYRLETTLHNTTGEKPSSRH